MAIVEVKVPQLSESVAEATLLQWKKKVGDAVTADEILIDIETDKVVLECPAPSSGVLVEIVQGDGATVAADQLIAKIDTAAVAGAAAAVCEQHQALGPWRQRELALQARGPDVHDFQPGLHGRGQQHRIPLLPIDRDGVG